MKKLSVLMFAAVVVAGCASRPLFTMFVNPNGSITSCRGDAVSPQLKAFHDNCVTKALASGSLPHDEAGYLGIVPSADKSSVTILKVLPNSPAERSQLKSGEEIRQIDGKAVSNWDDAGRLLFGKVNTTVVLLLNSPAGGRSVTLIREARGDQPKQ